MSRYIDREALLEWIEAVDGCLADGTVEAPTLYAQIITDIQQFPPPIVDVVEVVRCKDCKHYNYGICIHDFACNLIRADDYCSYGERSEG